VAAIPGQGSTPAHRATLDDRYTKRDGMALLGGIHAIVRLLLEQRWLDAERGLRTGMFISGYPGSPLGGVDRELARAADHLGPAGVVFRPGVNEELAATAVAGSQLIEELPGRQVDGVTGFFYGKAPGLDRAADAIRHGNTSGTSHLGGAVALIGDDPLCKSSTLPSSCELMAESLVLPLFSPSGVADIIRLGLHAVAMSRHAGLWTAMKIVSDVADASARVALRHDWDEIPQPPDRTRGAPPMLLGASSVDAEHDLMTARLRLAMDYAREHELNRVVFEPARPQIAVIAPGLSFATLERALQQLRLDQPALEQLGLRLVRCDLAWPLHPDDVADFASGVERVLVIEDKRPFIERQLRDMLYRGSTSPQILGKHDGDGRPLVPHRGAVDADALVRVLARVWREALPTVARDGHDQARALRRSSAKPLPVARTPFYCSGCPHNLSTRAPEDQLVGAGIGCHSLVALDPARERGRLLGAPQMGGEGAQWIGMAPFTTDREYVQNLGDGTFHHSGSLAIRAAVAAGVTITYRLLYNDAIAMTGGQPPPGRIGVAELTRWLELEGVRKIIITTEAPETFRGQRLSARSEVRHRRELAAVQRELSALDGVTVLIHADRCATEERRLRRRGRLATPAQRVWINERVCEGCGDCGRVSSCLSVVPTETEFGRKTQIHQSSCTQDFACVDGDCPSFMLVTPTPSGRAKQRAPDPPTPLPEPEQPTPSGALIRMPGIGGTGVVTVSQILQTAAIIDGKWASGLDQTGLAQKGGAVVSDVRIADSPQAGSPRAADGEVDVLLCLDPLGAIDAATLRTLSPKRTVAVVNLHTTPTAAMVTDPDAPGVPLAEIVSRVEAATRADRAIWLDAGSMAERLFSDHMPTNLIMLGAAYQHGCLPVSGDAIRKAIELNGTGLETNLAAFEWGRAAVVDRAAVERHLSPTPASTARPLPTAVTAMLAATKLPPDLRPLVERLAADLLAYQSRDYAQEFVAEVEQIHSVETRTVPSQPPVVTVAYARGLHKLMAYKDEYEVARLHLDELERARRVEAFGERARVAVLLHPPLLRTLGWKRKIKLGRSARPLFTVLRSARRLRGTALDPFGRTRVRRAERQLVADYRALLADALVHLRPETQSAVADLAALPDLVRGYEDVKLAAIERFRETAADRLGALRSTEPPASAEISIETTRS
jgi:indolepyruvate ferredoxin oxidoreductase